MTGQRREEDRPKEEAVWCSQFAGIDLKSLRLKSLYAVNGGAHLELEGQTKSTDRSPQFLFGRKDDGH